MKASLLTIIRNSLTASFVIIATVSFAQIDSALIAHWPLNGNAQDITVNKHHGFLIGDLKFVPNRFGIPDCAISTSSPSAYISINNSISIDSAAGISVSYWSKTIAFDSTYDFGIDGYFNFETMAIQWAEATEDAPSGVLDKRQGSVSSPLCSLFVNTGSNRNGVASLSGTNCTPKWEHVVVVFKKPNGPFGSPPDNQYYLYPIEIYKNNVKQNAFGNSFVGLKPTLTNLVLAKNLLHSVGGIVNNQQVDLTDKNKFEFAIDEIRLYNRELNATDVAKLYTAANSCGTVTAIDDNTSNKPKATVVKAYNFLGQEVLSPENYTGLVILFYSDGTKQKIIK